LFHNSLILQYKDVLVAEYGAEEGEELSPAAVANTREKLIKVQSSVADPWLFWYGSWYAESMPLNNGSGSCYFTKYKFFWKFFCLLLFEGTFTSFLKDKKQKKVTKQ
jgi:hypothetical protein